jgi:pimeloyl-ACP methyl ester carboxylesterase/AraC-like DNA-binding protein
MDVLTDILSSLRLTGGVVIDAETSGDWCLLSRFTEEDCVRFEVSGDLIAYHYVRSGHLFASLDGAPPVEAKPGDIILLPRNDPHLLYSRSGLQPVDSHELIQQAGNGPAKILIEGEGEPASIYCGFLGVSAEHHPLLDSLPPLLKLDGNNDVHGDWVETSMRLLNEARNSPELVTRVAELFFAEAIRRYMEQLPPDQGGWLAGLRDPAIGKALAIIHSRFAEELDVETLAREAGVSRSVLGERFTELLGEPPMRYCARWRMRLAANMLRDGKQNASNIAYTVGFNSEAAFTRAFKREFGEPPATWRRKIEEEAKARKERSSELPDQVVRHCTAKDGTRLAFSVAGDGPPLVKAANWLSHIEYDWHSPVWRHWLKEFTNGRCFIRYDERATGLSDWDTPEISFDAFVDDLESVVDCLGLEKFDLFGISQGGAVAIAYAVRHPERVRKLVICGGYACGWAHRADPEELARREAMLTLTEVGWGGDNPAYRQLFTNLFIPGATAKQQDWFNDLQRMSTSPENAVKLQRVLSKIDVRELLPQLKVPTLIFHARDDHVVPFSAGEYLARNIAGSTFVPVEGDNHIFLEHEQAWQAFSRVTREFLDKEKLITPAVQPPAAPAEREESVHSCSGKDGTKIAYAVAGEGFPIFKAPNWMTHLEHDWSSPVYGHWLQLGVELGRLIRMDMRGFGLSDWEPRDFSFDAMIGDMEAVIEDASVEQCDMIAVSHGAALAIAYAARHPERVRKLVLVNSFAAGWRVRADPEEVAWRESLMEMNRRRPSFRRSLLGEMFITLYFPSASQPLIDWHNELFQTLGPVPSMERMIELASWIDVREDLPKIRAQTLVFHATRDGNAPVDVGRQVADGIAGARFIELDSANHVLLGDEPAWRIFARETRAFLRTP